MRCSRSPAGAAWPLALLGLLTALTSAQSILPSTLPTCASSCTLLTQAQDACASAPDVTVCFCQSAYLSSLYTSSNNICSPQCSSADMGTIQSWYKGYCPAQAAAAVGSTVTPTATTTAATVATNGATNALTTTVSTTSATTTTTSTSGSSGSTSSSTSSSGQQQGWFATHRRWIIMLIVLAVGLSLLALTAVLVKRRYSRKREAARIAAQPDMGTWAPGTHSVHDFGTGEVLGGGAREKGKARDGVNVVAQESPTGSTGSRPGQGGKRLSKGFF